MAINTYTKGQAVKLSNNFNSTEFDCKGSGCCGSTLIDDKLVEYLQKIREHFDKPITITSGYRCGTHNSRVGGASGSRHTKGQAADIIISGVTPAEVAKYAESIGVLGIGLYSSFVHIDTRDYKSFWYSDKQYPRTTFGGSTADAADTSSTGSTDSDSAAIELTVSLPLLAQGSKGKYVKILQALLGITADGIFGANTKVYVVQAQKKNNLTADGVVGVDTWKALFK